MSKPDQFSNEVWETACKHFATMERSQEIPMLCRAILAERERYAPLVAALKKIAMQTRGDDINNPPEIRAAYYSGRFFTAQKIAREAVELVEG